MHLTEVRKLSANELILLRGQTSDFQMQFQENESKEIRLAFSKILTPVFIFHVDIMSHFSKDFLHMSYTEDMK